MPTITYLLADGTKTDIKVDVGANVMRTAIDADIPGIVAECGGAAMCATCHVYLEPETESVFTAISDVEEEMLECVADDRQPESRLSCQLNVPAGVDRITVRLPKTQS
ncbi:MULTISPECIES: 2Fe-2S iron-sulfur cluster-binding protein [Rhodobacterales]|jgi:ferredoxin, 2Fe-2S|uniref:Ferredoxin n=2 Tax=Rhodobacterales TaxID=204455 RepID=K2IXG3_9RHOB|nr:MULTISPECIES: 2Fe-2S iron-sulfur cluster-binding protein [Rhodobacterales]EKE67553.1 ferredoxin [Celeribacter baekdonensis B30]TMV89836.1 (2Fe-2S)-binding protein [Thioclava sp. BHET1]SPF82010.1 Rhodocoxin [Pseudoprimorskyibacter insulae]